MADITATYGTTTVIPISVGSDITGDLLWFTVKRDWLDADADALIALTEAAGITIDNAAEGEAHATITPALWAALPNEPARLVYSVQRLEDEEAVVSSVASGRLIVAANAQGDSE